MKVVSPFRLLYYFSTNIFKVYSSKNVFSKVYVIMKNFKMISSKNLLENLSYFQTKKICAMVKSNAYGHGVEQIVNLIENKVDYFGVVNVEEGLAVRKLTKKPILICSKVTNYECCRKNKLEIMIDDESDLRNAVKCGLKNSLHLKINCGMNRFGVKSLFALRGIDNFLQTENIKLKSIYTHFPRTEDSKSTNESYQLFEKFRREVSQDTMVCFGGSGIFDYGFEFDMLRLGICLYGYNNKNLKPVMKIVSFVSKIFYAKRGEHIGYGNEYIVGKDSFFAVVPVGYGDGLRRNLSGNFRVTINGKTYQSVGNICMDAFFVKIDGSVGVGDKVEVMNDAEYFAKKLKTISYEVLTSFSCFRGETIIV